MISDFHRALKSSMMFNIPKFHMIWCFLEHKWSMFKTRQQQSWLWRSPLAAVPHVGKHLKRKGTTRVYVMTMHAVKVVCVHYVKHWHDISSGYKFDSMMWWLTFMSGRPGLPPQARQGKKGHSGSSGYNKNRNIDSSGIRTHAREDYGLNVAP